MGLSYIACQSNCDDCPFIDMRIIGFKMIKEAATMSGHERHIVGIGDDPIYDMYKCGDALHGIMSRIDALAMAHKEIVLHKDRETAYGGPTIRTGRETTWDTRFGPELCKVVNDVTPTFALTKFPTSVEANNKGEHMKVFCIVATLGKKPERRAALLGEDLRRACTYRFDARGIGGKIAIEEEMAEQGRIDGGINKKVTSKDRTPPTQADQEAFRAKQIGLTTKLWTHAEVRVPHSFLTIGQSFATGITRMSPFISLPCSTDLDYDETIGMILMHYSKPTDM